MVRGPTARWGPAVRTERRAWMDSADAVLCMEATDTSDIADPIEPKDIEEPMDPIDSTLPTEPMDSTDPTEPMDRKESFDHKENEELSSAREDECVMGSLCPAEGPGQRPPRPPPRAGSYHPRKALPAKAALFQELGLRVHLCGDVTL